MATVAIASRTRTAYAGDPNGAIERAYGAVRWTGTDYGRAYTHWEFYRACQDNGFGPEQIDVLRTLTERFERNDPSFDRNHQRTDWHSNAIRSPVSSSTATTAESSSETVRTSVTRPR